MTYRAWDVVVVPFPYSDRLAEKRRPALIVSSDALNRRGWMWVAMITSAIDQAGDGDVVIGNLEGTGLPVPSLIRVTKIATIEPGRVMSASGRLSDDDRRAVSECFRRYSACATA